MNYLTFESREEDLPALMLLAVSLRRCAPQSVLHLPVRDMSSEATDWFARQPNVVTHKDLWAQDTFWNREPYLLEKMLDLGLDRVTWLDGDIVVTANPAELFRVPQDTMVVAQEGFRSRERGTGQRTWRSAAVSVANWAIPSTPASSASQPSTTHCWRVGRICCVRVFTTPHHQFRC